MVDDDSYRWPLRAWGFGSKKLQNSPLRFRITRRPQPYGLLPAIQPFRLVKMRSAFTDTMAFKDTIELRTNPVQSDHNFRTTSA